MPTPSRVGARAAIPRAAVEPRPLQNTKPAFEGRSLARISVPWATVRPRPLENFEISCFSSTGARDFIPWSAVLSSALEEIEPPKSRDASAHRNMAAPRTTSATQSTLKAPRQSRNSRVLRHRGGFLGAVLPPGFLPADRYQRKKQVLLVVHKLCQVRQYVGTDRERVFHRVTLRRGYLGLSD